MHRIRRGAVVVLVCCRSRAKFGYCRTELPFYVRGAMGAYFSVGKRNFLTYSISRFILILLEFTHYFYI